MKQRGLGVGDTIELSMNGQAFDYRVIGSMESRADDAQAVIPAACAVVDFGQSECGQRFSLTHAQADLFYFVSCRHRGDQ